MTLSARAYRERPDIHIGRVARRAPKPEAAAERKRHRNPRLRIRRDSCARPSPLALRALGVQSTRTATAIAQQKR